MRRDRCARVHFVAIKDMTAKEFQEAALAPLPNTNFQWVIVASGVDYDTSTPLFHPFCWFGVDSLCRSVPWIVVYRTDSDRA